MKAKVFENEKVKVLENEINSWLKDNQNVEIMKTAVASNQFIILYNEPVEEPKEPEPEPVDVEEPEPEPEPVEEPSPEIKINKLGDRPISNGIVAPHISDYYEEWNKV